MYKFLLISLLVLSCSTGTKTPKKETKQIGDSCANTSQSIDKRHLVIAAKSKAPELVSCFKNYLRFEENKKQKISTCNILTIKRNGSVKFAYSRGHEQSRLPKAMKMCMEQEFWKMRFKGLQLGKAHTIKFSLVFNSI
jgi:hypothetical protein